MTRRTYSSPLWDRRRWLQQVGLGLGSLALGGLGGCGGGDETASTLSSGWSWPTGMTAR